MTSTAHGHSPENDAGGPELAHLAALGRLVRVINRTPDLSAAMECALKEVLAVLDFDGGGIYLVEPGGETARVRCARNLPEDFLAAVGLVDVDADAYRPVFREGAPLFLEEYASVNPERAASWGFQSLAAIPLPSEGSIIGALNVVSTRRHAFTAYERELLLGVGEELGIAFARSSLLDALTQARADLHAFFDLSPDMLFVLDSDGVVIEVNAEVLRQLGYTREECRGRSVFDFHPPDQRDAVANTVTRMLSGLERSCWIPLRTKQGDDVPVETRVAAGTWGAQDALFGICRASRAERVLDATLAAFTSALEIRDPFTSGHSRHVARVAKALAEKLGMLPDHARLVEIAAMLHDVGKLSTPSDILTKPGTLTPGEFAVVKEHSQSSYDLLKPMEFLGPIPQIVLQHHERLDGSGYPNGLVGDDILIEARILAVADVVEAISSHRPDRPALPFRAALNEVEGGGGGRYDRDVADALFALYNAGELPLEASKQRQGRRKTPAGSTGRRKVSATGAATAALNRF